jgi:probable rRNA maturation factor
MLGVTQSALRRFLARARSTAGLSGSVNLLVTHSADVRELNRRYRGKDQPTDVLSFPAVPALNNGFAGDIVISGDIAARNARAYGHATANELKILILHGVLHLAGHDHETDAGEMARKEERLRRALRLPIGLIARAGNQAPRVRSRPFRMRRKR